LLGTTHSHKLDDVVSRTRLMTALRSIVTGYSWYLPCVCRAFDAGVRVTHYFAWSFTDNWEWREGFTTRFGVDPAWILTNPNLPRRVRGERQVAQSTCVPELQAAEEQLEQSVLHWWRLSGRVCVCEGGAFASGLNLENDVIA